MTTKSTYTYTYISTLIWRYMHKQYTNSYELPNFQKKYIYIYCMEDVRGIKNKISSISFSAKISAVMFLKTIMYFFNMTQAE